MWSMTDTTKVSLGQTFSLMEPLPNAGTNTVSDMERDARRTWAMYYYTYILQGSVN